MRSCDIRDSKVDGELPPKLTKTKPDVADEIPIVHLPNGIGMDQVMTKPSFLDFFNTNSIF